jgi:hypothetical protein
MDPAPVVRYCLDTTKMDNLTCDLISARCAVMHSLSVASRVALHGASRPFPRKYAPKTVSISPLKIPPLENACLFPPAMLHYKHSRLNGRLRA